MKNIKIITFHNAENYGAVLQAYALKEVLKKLNTNPSFVNYINKDILKDYKLIRTNSVKSFLSSIYYLPRNLKRKTAFKKFMHKYLDGDLPKYYCKEQIEETVQQDEIYVAGSDQIFNPMLTSGLSDIYTLNFGNNITKVVYGASVGNDESLNKYSEEFKEKLKSIDMLSVREANIAKALEQITNRQVETVLDPTLLLTKTEWDNLIKNTGIVSNINSKKYILVYTLFEDSEITKMVNWLSNKTGLKIVNFRKYNIYEKKATSLYTKGPVDFINAFKNAEYIITNSFHGLVFSIIFEKKFYAIMPKERQGRLKDLISTLNLRKRSISKFEEILDKDLDESIQYETVKEKLEALKTHSIEFLIKGINL